MQILMLMWQPSVGASYMQDGQGQILLNEKPDLPFAFDEIVYYHHQQLRLIQDGAEMKPIELTGIEQAAIHKWCAAKRDETGAVVHAVDVKGRYLGFVSTKDPAFHRAAEIFPPSEDHWLYDFNTSKWNYVHGVAEDGTYLGNVDIDACAAVATSPPPDHYHKWDDKKRRWEDCEPVEVAQQRVIAMLELSRWTKVSAVVSAVPEEKRMDLLSALSTAVLEAAKPLAPQFAEELAALISSVGQHHLQIRAAKTKKDVESARAAIGQVGRL